MIARKLMPEQMGFDPAGHGYTMLAKRSVNIFSDLNAQTREGDLITIRGELIGFDGKDVSLQWQMDDGFIWIDVPGANDLTYSFVATPESVNISWRLSITVNE